MRPRWSRLVYLGEHYVVDLGRGWRSRSRSRWPRRRSPKPATRLSRTLQLLERMARVMARRARADHEPRPPRDDNEDDERGLEFSGRTVLTLCGFLAAMILGLYFLLPQLAGLEDTWQRIEDGSPLWMLIALGFAFGMFGATSRCSAASSRRPPRA